MSVAKLQSTLQRSAKFEMLGGAYNSIILSLGWFCLGKTDQSIERQPLQGKRKIQVDMF